MSSPRATAFRLAPVEGEANPAQRPFCMDGHVIPSEPHDALSRELEVRIARRVALAVAARAVEREAVDLDREALGWPIGVDLVSAGLSTHQGIEEGAGDVRGCLQQLLEPPLELAPLGACPVGVDHPPQHLRTPPPPRPFEHLDDVSEVEQSKPPDRRPPRDPTA